jgi:hypothetical protein
MRRRELITLIGGAAIAWPLAAHAQQPDRMRRIGVLMGFPESDSQAQSYIAAFQDRLQKLGWTDGRNKCLLMTQSGHAMVFREAVGVLHPVSGGPEVSVSMRARRRSPLHVPPNRIRESQ